MRKLLSYTLTLAVLASCPAAGSQAAKGGRGGTDRTGVARQTTYDGTWWLRANTDEQSGFLSGAGDCLYWVAHAPWLSRWVDDLRQKITSLYTSRPQDRKTPVKEVWRRVLSEAPPARPRPPGGEVWTNPHGYFNGLWWRQSSGAEARGFLEGYLWCLRNCVNGSLETYSHSIEYYEDRIDGYISKHPKADDEAIAAILSRFRDRPKR
jgi:hypothetical protein